ncbi:MAG: type II toxin-antitoxin system prevent-host-death family antitoxin [Actinomycetota bacterium]
MTVVNVAEAKTHLSRLLDAAAAGEEVVLARNGTPVARLVPVEPPPTRELGFVALDMPDDRFDPLDGDDLAAWS